MADEIDFTTITCNWEDKDNDIVVQYEIDKKLNLSNVTDLHYNLN